MSVTLVIQGEGQLLNHRVLSARVPFRDEHGGQRLGGSRVC